MLARLHTVILMAATVALVSGACRKERAPDARLCERVIDHALGLEQDLLGSQYAQMEAAAAKLRRDMLSECRRKGISRAKADCVLYSQHILSVRACDGLAAR